MIPVKALAERTEDSGWYVVSTKPRQEARALENLGNQGCDCFLPTLVVEFLRENSHLPEFEGDHLTSATALRELPPVLYLAPLQLLSYQAALMKSADVDNGGIW